MLTYERLHEVLHFEPDTGKWRWLVAMSSNRVHVGDDAGSVRKDGRRRIQVDGHSYLSSRLAWFFMKGSWPKAQIDHRDLNRANDRWNNLREATNVQNNRNKPGLGSSYTGVKGVRLRMKSGRPYAWEVSICGSNSRRYAYCYGTLAEAGALYEQWAHEIHGEFARVE